MQLPPETLASAEKALREQLRPVIRRALAGATADVLAEGGILAALSGTVVPDVPTDAPPHEVAPPSRKPRTAPTPESEEPGKRIRRSPEQLAELVDRFVAFVNKNPGARAPTIADHLGMTVEKLRTLQNMVKEGGKIETTGTKVHTQYWPVGKGPKPDKKARKAG